MENKWAKDNAKKYWPVMNDPKVDCHEEIRQIFMNIKMIPWFLLLFGSSIMLNMNGYWKYPEYQELQYGSLVVAYS